MLLLMAAMGSMTFYGIAAGQVCRPCTGLGLPVTAAGPGWAIASAGGATAGADVTGAVAVAGGVMAGASAVYPAAFAEPVTPLSPYCSACPPV